jgi:S1-C subfamily serine protease
VEIDGVAVGTTPFEKDYPGGYFHRTRTLFGSRLEHPLIARVSLTGYVTKEITLTEGPMNWISLNGRNHTEYWLFKTTHFHVELQSLSQTFTGGVAARLSNDSSVDLRPALPFEELVSRAKPAVVYLKGTDKSGSGFFVTGTGVIATNAHVAREEETLLALLPGGQQLEAKVVYIDPELDIALAKIESSQGKDEFPHLILADAATVQEGESVLAIGNPGDAMPFSATKGIVSAIGKFSNAGPGTWIQTDAPINPGNSGGPLLNRHQHAKTRQEKRKRDWFRTQRNGLARSSSSLLPFGLAIQFLGRFFPSLRTTYGPRIGRLWHGYLHISSR